MDHLLSTNGSNAFVTISLVLTMMLLAGGCAQPLFGPSESSHSNVKIQGLTIQQLGTLGAKLYQNHPNQTSLLAEYEITELQFGKAMRTISNDPTLSRHYRNAYEEELQS